MNARTRCPKLRSKLVEAHQPRTKSLVGADLFPTSISWQHNSPRASHSPRTNNCHCIASEHANIFRTEAQSQGARNTTAFENCQSAPCEYCALTRPMYRSPQAIRRLNVLRTNDLGQAGRYSAQCKTSKNRSIVFIRRRFCAYKYSSLLHLLF